MIMPDPIPLSVTTLTTAGATFFTKTDISVVGVAVVIVSSGSGAGVGVGVGADVTLDVVGRVAIFDGSVGVGVGAGAWVHAASGNTKRVITNTMNSRTERLARLVLMLSCYPQLCSPVILSI